LRAGHRIGWIDDDGNAAGGRRAGRPHYGARRGSSRDLKEVAPIEMCRHLLCEFVHRILNLPQRESIIYYYEARLIRKRTTVGIAAGSARRSNW
jgi:hypothetical protein